ncbi:MAG: TerC family protein [Bacteroidetes bacterium]|jgi:predicted tellurium resistance membrane protein TerC|nr:TerC family protein [Bacteroidota bacterium]
MQEELSVILTVDGLISLLTLVIMEIVLGIDNIIFISILAGKLPYQQQAKARRIGLSLALIIRIALLFSISWIVSLKEPFITIMDHGFSGRDMVLLFGGLFLMAKSTSEIHGKISKEEHLSTPGMKKLTLNMAIAQIIGLDIVFSFDSILTAVGLVDHVSIMILAVIISMIVMLISAKSVSDFVNKHPTIKMLALSFLLMIGFMLTIEAFHYEVPKGYIYFAMAFSLLVELLNMRIRKKSSAE